MAFVMVLCSRVCGTPRYILVVSSERAVKCWSRGRNVCGAVAAYGGSSEATITAIVPGAAAAAAAEPVATSTTGAVVAFDAGTLSPCMALTGSREVAGRIMKKGAVYAATPLRVARGGHWEFLFVKVCARSQYWGTDCCVNY